jgi:hypothetical protein
MRSTIVAVSAFTVLQACSGPAGEPGEDGAPGRSCTVAQNPDGTATITCPDGSSATVTPGEPGGDGSDGADAAVRLSEEAPGPSCAFGGTRIEVGTDDDGNGVLDDVEVDDTLFACNAADAEGIAIVGDVVIDEPLDLGALANVRSITGNLIVTSDQVGQLHLPVLEEVTGRLDVSGAAGLSAISLPRLSTLGEIVTREGGGGAPLVAAALNLTQIELPAATRIGRIVIGSVFDRETIPLDVLSLPSLEEVDQLFLTNTRLTTMAMPSLVRAVTLNFVFARTIQTMDFGSIVDVNTIIINNADVLVSIAGLSELETASGGLTIESSAVSSVEAPLLATAGRFRIFSTGITSLSGFTSLQSVASLDIRSNPALTELGLDALRVVSGDGIGAVDDFGVTSNPVLLDCHVDALLAQLVTLTGTTDIRQNGGPGACP